jgi:hypothetical protein
MEALLSLESRLISNYALYPTGAATIDEEGHAPVTPLAIGLIVFDTFFS